MTTVETAWAVLGGGIGGMAAALSLARQGHAVQVLEQAEVFSEVGAGVQLGPNVTRLLREWGLQEGLMDVAFAPQRLQARDAGNGRLLGELPLATRAIERYGAPYVCIHRADLHTLLWQAAVAEGVPVLQGACITELQATPDAVTLQAATGHSWRAQALVGADGLWSRSRALLGLHDKPRFSGHLAYRALVPQTRLPAALRSHQVTVWMGPRLHVVEYPVQSGHTLNIVAIVHGDQPADPTGWDQEAQTAQLWRAMGAVCPLLQDRLRAVAHWRLWPLNDRPPLTGAAQMAHGRVALLGDAAHPMRPYLAQGAGMAIEDAWALGACASAAGDVSTRLAAYAAQRWARNARVQARAARNGQIFHASGPLAWGRNLALAASGGQVMDVPWLYKGMDALVKPGHDSVEKPGHGSSSGHPRA